MILWGEMRSKCWSVVMLAVLVAACGDDDGADPGTAPDAGVAGPGPGSFVVGASASEGVLSFVVVDGVTGAPIPDAAITVGATTSTTTISGAATLSLATGRATVIVNAAGHVRWMRELAIGRRPLRHEVHLLPAFAGVVVGSAGATIGVFPNMAVIPLDAVPDGTSVAVTLLDPADVAYQVPRVQFSTADGARTHHMVAAAIVDVSTVPQLPIAVTSAVPAHAVATGLTIWRLGDDGEWDAPVAPSMATESSATFDVIASGTYGVSVDRDVLPAAGFAAAAADPAPPGDVVTATSPGATVEVAADGGGLRTVPVEVGMEILDGNILHTVDGMVATTDPNGESLSYLGRTDVSIGHCGETACYPGSASDVVIRGSVVGVSNPSVTTIKNKIKIRMQNHGSHGGTYNDAMGTRGTVFEYTVDRCAGRDRVISRVQVYDGVVDVDADHDRDQGIYDLDTEVAAGGDLTMCSDCLADQEPTCGDCPLLADGPSLGSGVVTELTSCRAFEYWNGNDPPEQEVDCQRSLAGFTSDGAHALAGILAAGSAPLVIVDSVACRVDMIESYRHEFPELDLGVTKYAARSFRFFPDRTYEMYGQSISDEIFYSVDPAFPDGHIQYRWAVTAATGTWGDP